MSNKRTREYLRPNAPRIIALRGDEDKKWTQADLLEAMESAVLREAAAERTAGNGMGPFSLYVRKRARQKKPPCPCRRTLSSIECGNKAHPMTLLIIAAALGVPLSEIVLDDERDARLARQPASDTATMVATCDEGLTMRLRDEAAFRDALESFRRLLDKFDTVAVDKKNRAA